MIDYMIMLCITTFLGGMLVLRDKKGKGSSFFDQETTGALRGFWCLIVLLVHVPAAYQNRLQDMLGSFAYIGVTFFFMTSGYGLMLGVHKNGTAVLNGFWRRRIVRLLVPMVLVNFLTCLVDWGLTGSASLWTLVGITGFVRQLLLFYILFWLVFRVPCEKLSAGNRECILCVLIAVISIVFYLFDGLLVFGWPVETLGFLYGIVLARHKDRFVKYASGRWLLKVVAACIVSLLLGVLYLKTKPDAFFGDYLVKIALGLGITVFMLLGNAGFSLGNPVSRFLGSISYEVYLLHSLVFVCVDALPGEIGSGWFILISMVGTVGLSVAVFWIKIMTTKQPA